MFGWGDPGAAFSAVIQIGTEIAVLVYFRKDIKQVLQNLLRIFKEPAFRATEDAKSSIGLVVGSLPILVIGFLLRDVIETDVRNLYLVSIMLILFGIVLINVEKYAKIRKKQNLTIASALTIGMSQALALVPGVSRSGATISTGLALGYSREHSTRFAFLLAIPAVFASGFFELRKGFSGGFQWGPTILATAVSFVIGIIVIHWLLKFITKYSFKIFGWYRIILGVLILCLLYFGVLA